MIKMNMFLYTMMNAFMAKSAFIIFVITVILLKLIKTNL